MDAFKKVDNSNLKPVFKSDGQGAWQAFRENDKAKQPGATKQKVGSIPFFPKLGNATAPEDSSNYAVGQHNEVRAPSQVANKQPDQKRARVEGDEYVASISPEETEQTKWTKLIEPETQKPYWFNAELGETTFEDPYQNNQLLQQEVGVNFDEPHDEEPMSSEERSKLAMAQVKAAIENQRNGKPKQQTKVSLKAKERWKSTVDPESRRTYWYHIDTKETQWGPPRGDQLQ